MLLTHEHCYVCDKKTDHHDGKCSDCASKQQAEAEATWKAMTLEDRIEVLRNRLDHIEMMNRIIR